MAIYYKMANVQILADRQAISDTKGPLRKQQCRWIDERGGTGLICVADAENAKARLLKVKTMQSH